MDFFKAKATLHRYPTDFLIGDLLVKAGVISSKQLDEAIKLSGAKHLQVGQMLIMSGSINSSQLQAAVDAQSLVRDRTIDINDALKLLKVACKSGQTIAEVVAGGTTTKIIGPTNKLGEVLLEAGLVTPDQFAKAMQRSLSTGLPLGRILVLNNTLADAILNMALDLQVRIRDEMLTRAEAVELLRHAAGLDGEDMPDQALIEQAQAALRAPRKHGIRIGEMFVKAGLLTETDVMNALETGLATDQPIGQVLVGQGFITEQILEAALGLQKMVDGRHLEVDKAVDTLSKIQSSGITYDEAVSDLIVEEVVETATVGFDRMLVLARVLTESQIEDSFKAAMEDAKIIGQILVMTGHVEKNTLKAALRAHFLLRRGAISQDDAVVGLDYCMHSSNRLSFDGALQELGWDISTLPAEEIDPEVRAYEEARKGFGLSTDDEGDGLSRLIKQAEQGEKSSQTIEHPATADDAEPISLDVEVASSAPQEVQSPVVEEVSAPPERESLQSLFSEEVESPVTPEAEEPAPVVEKKASRFASLLDGADEPVVKKAETAPPVESVQEPASPQPPTLPEPLAAPEPPAPSPVVAPEPPKKASFANLLGGDDNPVKKTEPVIAPVAAVSEPVLESAPEIPAESPPIPAAEVAPPVAPASAPPVEPSSSLDTLTPTASPVKKFGSFANLLGGDEPVAKPVPVAPAPEPQRVIAPVASIDPEKLAEINFGDDDSSANFAAITPPTAQPTPSAPAPASAPAPVPVADALSALTRKTPPVASAAPVGDAQSPPAPQVTPESGIQVRAATPQPPSNGALRPSSSPTLAGIPAMAPVLTGAQTPQLASRSESEVKDALNGSYARMAESYYDQGNYSEAQNLYEKILSVRETELGESDPELIADLANLVRVLCVQAQFAQAETYVRRIISILEMAQPNDTQKLADALNTLAQIYFQQGKFEHCQPVLDRSVRLKQQVLGENHIDMADCYRDYARLMRKLNRTDEAETYYNRAKVILGKAPRQAVV